MWHQCFSQRTYPEQSDFAFTFPLKSRRNNAYAMKNVQDMFAAGNMDATHQTFHEYLGKLEG